MRRNTIITTMGAVFSVIISAPAETQEKSLPETLTFQVVLEPDATPASGLELGYSKVTWDKQTREMFSQKSVLAHTDENGFAHIRRDDLPADAYITIRGPQGYSDVVLFPARFVEEPPTWPLRVPLPRAAQARGRVVDERDQPVSSGVVLAGHSAWLELPCGVKAKLVSLDNRHPVNQDGTFTIPKFSEKAESALIDFISETHLKSLTAIGKSDPEEKRKRFIAQLLDGSFTLKTVTGRKFDVLVTDESGQPVAGATISHFHDPSADSIYIREQTTDSRGRAIILVRSDLQTEVSVSHPDFAESHFLAPPPEGEDLITVKLNRGRQIDVIVTDRFGKPVEGATITPVHVSRDESSLAQVPMTTRLLHQTNEAVTDTNGRAALKNAPLDTNEIEVQHDDYAVKTVSVSPDVREISVELTELVALNVRVVDADSGAPLRGAWIGLFSSPRHVDDWKNVGAHISREKDNEGLILLQTPHTDARYQLRTTIFSHQDGQSEIFTLDEGRRDISIRLKKRPAAKVTVKTPDGQGAAGAKVFYVTSTELISVESNELPSSSDSTTCDEAGIAHTPNDASKFTLVAVHNSGFGLAHATKGTEEILVRLKPWASISGKIGGHLKREKPITITAEVSGLRSSHDDNWPEFPRTLFKYKTKADDSGNFTFPRLPSGEPFVLKSSDRVISDELILQPGEHRTLNFPGPGATVRAVITFPQYNLRGDEKPSISAVIRRGPEVKYRLPENFNELSVFQQRLLIKSQEESLSRVIRENSGAENLVRIFDRNIQDGKLKVELLQPGIYHLHITQHRGEHWSWNWLQIESSVLADAVVSFTITEEQAANPDKEVDLGEIKLQPTPMGMTFMANPAPPLRLHTADGSLFDLSAMRGKIVLIDFRSARHKSLAQDFSKLEHLHETHARAGKFAMISVRLVHRQEIESELPTGNPPWPVAFVTSPPDRGRIKDQWFLLEEFPLVLIGADGVIRARAKTVYDIVPVIMDLLAQN